MDYMGIIKKLDDNMDNIKTFGVTRIGLFGSFVRDDQTDKSDIDILVVFRKDQENFDNYMGLLFFLEKLFSKRVDLVIYDNVREELRDSIYGSVKYASEL